MVNSDEIGRNPSKLLAANKSSIEVIEAEDSEVADANVDADATRLRAVNTRGRVNRA